VLPNRVDPLLFALGTSKPVALLRSAFRFIHRPVTYAGDGIILTQSVLGHLLHFDAHDTSLLPSVLVRGYWEPGLTRAMLRLIQPGHHVVEIGANVGYYTILFASRVGASGSVTAFEPNPRAHELLRRSIAANGFVSVVRAVPMAVCDRAGQLTLHRLARQQGSSSIYAFGPADLATWDDTAAPIDVEATSLDTFYTADMRVPDLVKVDAEGAEPAVIAGMQGLIARAPGLRIVLEFLPAALTRGSHDPARFLASLIALGLRLHVIDRRGRILPTTADALLAMDYADLYLSR